MSVRKIAKKKEETFRKESENRPETNIKDRIVIVKNQLSEQ